MKNNFIKKIPIVLILILFILFILFIFSYVDNIKNKTNTNTNTEIVKVSLVDEVPKREKSIVSVVEKEYSKNYLSEENRSSTDVNSINVSISVEGRIYSVEVKDGSNIYEAMQKLSFENKNFVFTSKEYSGMGMFIDSINGVYGSDGKYWIYYLNDKKASVGVSKNILKAGDTVRWEKEGLIN